MLYYVAYVGYHTWNTLTVFQIDFGEKPQRALSSVSCTVKKKCLGWLFWDTEVALTANACFNEIPLATLI